MSRRRSTGDSQFQSLYKCAGRSYFNGSSSASDLPCHTARQGLIHPPSVASEAPQYSPRENSRATGRYNSSDVLSHRGGPTGVTRGSVDRREYQPLDEVEEETNPPMDSQY